MLITMSTTHLTQLYSYLMLATGPPLMTLTLIYFINYKQKLLKVLALTSRPCTELLLSQATLILSCGCFVKRGWLFVNCIFHYYAM